LEPSLKQKVGNIEDIHNKTFQSEASGKKKDKKLA
jgi:hypothetical protein